MLRLDYDKVKDLNLDKLFVRTNEGIQIPISEVATIDLIDGPLQINRDATKRRIVIGVNVRDADIQQVVNNIQDTLEKNIKLKPGWRTVREPTKCYKHAAYRNSGSIDADIAAAVLCFQVRHLYACGI